jgi:hypothetical protein
VANNLLTITSTIQCPHGGQAVLTTANSKVSAERATVLLESDVHTITGCPFTVGSSPSPCVRIDWSGGATKAQVNGTAVLLKTSIGQCLNAPGGVQGVAVIVNTQMKASAL